MSRSVSNSPLDFEITRVDCSWFIIVLMSSLHNSIDSLILTIFYTQVKDQLKKTSVTEFKGLASVEVLSLGWNIVMMEVKDSIRVCVYVCVRACVCMCG